MQTKVAPGAASVKTSTRSDTSPGESISLLRRASRCVPRSSSGLPLRTAGAVPAHFPSTSVRSAMLRSTILPCLKNPASSEATRSLGSSCFSRCASTQPPGRISQCVLSRRSCSALSELLRAAMTPRIPEEPLHGFHAALAHALVTGTPMTIAEEERPDRAWRGGARSVSWSMCRT